MTTTLTRPLRPSRHIEALLALDPDALSPNVASSVAVTPATQSWDADQSPDQWD